MTAHDVPVLWCVLQVALLSILGIAAGWVFSRRAPAAGATAAAAAAAMIAVVTALIPTPVPTLASWPADPIGDAIDASAPPALNDNPVASAEAGARSIDVAKLAAGVLASIGAGGVAKQDVGPLLELWMVRFFAVGAAVGIVRFLWSVSFVARLRRLRTPVVDGELLRLFTEIKSRLGVAQTVELCESAHVSSPAVIGWRRPVVLIPLDRDDWSAEQLRAALAHELAHVKRGDFSWRCVAGVTQAIHFFHPLVHLLTRRLTLMQELATDELAAIAAGGRETYLRALSELAIRLDDTSRLRAEPIVLPALSSNLVRRIAMLRSKEGSEAARRCRVASALAVGLIAAVGVGTLALRGNAEAVAPPTAGGAGEGKLFARPALNPAVLGQQDHGLFVVRVSELVKVSNLGNAYNVFRNMMMEELGQYGGVDEKFGAMLDASAIDYIAGAPKLILSKLPNEGPYGASVSTNVECHEFIVRFHDKVDWEPWIDAFTFDVEVTNDGFTYYELPAPAGEDAVTKLVAPRDDRTLVFSTDVERLRHLATCDPNAASDLSPAWNSIDGGLIAFIANANLDVGDALPTDELGPRMATIILQKSTQFGFALDADANRKSQVRVLLTAPHSEAAKEVQAACEKLAPLFIAEMKSVLENPAALVDGEADDPNRVQTAGDRNTQRDCARYYLTLLEDFSTQLQAQADGSVQVRVEADAVLPANVVTAYEPKLADESLKPEGEEQLR